MTVTALSGPIVQFGITLSSTSGDGITGQDFEHNEQRAPQITDLGDSFLDPRSAYAYEPGGGVTNLTFGFFNNQGIVDFKPTTASTNALVSTTASSGTSTFTLAAASTANGTYSTTIIAPETGKATGTLIALDSTAAYLAFGTAGSICMWNPGAGTGRNIIIRPSSNGDAGTFSVAGRDMYGYKMTETLAAGSTTITGKKAFKYISSITNCTTPVSTGVIVGFGDVFGFPLAVPYAGLNLAVYASSTAFGTAAAAVQSSATIVLASTVATQTSTTPDVRGTWASSLASNTGNVRIQIVVTPAASAMAAISSTNVSPLFGATQFSSV